jgi:outer membrane protein assembly factor BamA
MIAPQQRRRGSVLRFGLHRVIARALLALGLLWMGGCARPTTLAQVAGAQYRVRRIRFEGNEELSKQELLDHMNLAETRWFPLPQRRWFLEGLVPVDRERIEALYAARGYPDARVLSIEPRHRPRSRVLDVIITIDENAPTLVRNVEYSWPAGPPVGPRDRLVTPERIEGKCELEIGEPFDVQELETCRDALREGLRARGYAFASITPRAEVDRIARSANVTYTIIPGRYVKLGDIRVVGTKDVPEGSVINEVRGFRGRPFSPRRLHRIEEAVFAMDVFSSVLVETVETPDPDVVDVLVRVSEAKPQSLRLGGGLGLEPNRWEQYLAARYSHVNILRTLTRLDLRLRAGYAQLPAAYRPQEHGPVVDFEPRLRKKGLLERGLVWTAAPRLEVGIQEGYQFWSFQTRVGVSRFFTRFFELGLFHNFRYVDFFSMSDIIRLDQTILGPDFRDPYFLSYLSPEARINLTDRLVDPRNGVVMELRYDLAGGVLGGQFDYHKLTPQIRAYWTIVPRRLQLAARASAGFILPYGDRPGAPFDLKYYLGGAANVRGWGLRRLSPTLRTCDPDCRFIPIGGDTMVLGNFETRVRVWRTLWLVAFFDVGDVQSGRVDIRPDQWNYSIGPGLRLHTAIGVFRLDAGFRLNEDPVRFAAERGWALHFGLGEAF